VGNSADWDRRKDVFAEYLEMVRAAEQPQPPTTRTDCEDPAESEPEGADDEEPDKPPQARQRRPGEMRGASSPEPDDSKAVREKKGKRRPVGRPNAALRLPPGGKESRWMRLLVNAERYTPLIKTGVRIAVIIYDLITSMGN
jgi:hypothetical protein